MVSFSRSSLALFLVAFAAAAGTSDASGNLRQDARVLQSSDYLAEATKLVNAERAKHGLPKLCINRKLQRAAQRHADDEAKHDFMDHTGTDGSTMSQRVSEEGYKWTAVAENVAAGQVDIKSVVKTWIESSGHRRNILGDYTMMGCAFGYNPDSRYKFYWTQDFGKGGSEQCDDGEDKPEQIQRTTMKSKAPKTTAETPCPGSTTEAPETEEPEYTDAPATPCPETEETEEPEYTDAPETPCPETEETEEPEYTDAPETPCPETEETEEPEYTDAPATPCPETEETEAPVEYTDAPETPCPETEETEAPVEYTDAPTHEEVVKGDDNMHKDCVTDL